MDHWYDGALGNYYAGFAFLIEGNSLKELDECCKRARRIIEKPFGYNQWLIGMSTLLLCEVSLNGDLSVRMKTGGQLTVAWNQIGAAEGLSLAKSMLRENTANNHGLVAFYLLLNKQTESAARQLEKAGAQARACWSSTRTGPV